MSETELICQTDRQAPELEIPSESNTLPSRTPALRILSRAGGVRGELFRCHSCWGFVRKAGAHLAPCLKYRGAIFSADPHVHHVMGLLSGDPTSSSHSVAFSLEGSLISTEHCPHLVRGKIQLDKSKVPLNFKMLGVHMFPSPRSFCIVGWKAFCCCLRYFVGQRILSNALNSIILSSCLPKGSPPLCQAVGAEGLSSTPRPAPGRGAVKT